MKSFYIKTFKIRRNWERIDWIEKFGLFFFCWILYYFPQIKNKKEEHSKKLEEINGKNDQLKEKSENIKEIIDNLKPVSFNKNNKVISNEENEISIKDRIINELKNHQINNLESTI